MSERIRKTESSWEKECGLLVLLSLLTYLIGSMLATFVTDYALQMLVIQVSIAAPSVTWVILCAKGKFTKRTVSESLGIHPIRPVICLEIALLMLFVAPVLTFVNVVSQMFSSQVAGVEIVSSIIDYPYVVSVLVIGILPAICEEFVYRGMLFTGLKKLSLPAAAVVSGFVFGLMHLNLNQFCYAFLMGVVFCLTDETVGSTLAGAIMHCLVNTTSVTIAYIVKWIGKAEVLNTTVSTRNLFLIIYYLIPAAIGAVMSVYILRLIASQTDREEHMKKALKKNDFRQGLRRMLTPPLVFAGIILTVLMIVTELQLDTM